MIIRKEQPPATYVLTLDYTELHDLYYLMLDLSGRPSPSWDSTMTHFFDALKAHA